VKLASGLCLLILAGGLAVGLASWQRPPSVGELSSTIVNHRASAKEIRQLRAELARVHAAMQRRGGV